MKELICSSCKEKLHQWKDLKLIVRKGKLTINCSACGEQGIQVDIKDGRVVNRVEEEENEEEKT